MNKIVLLEILKFIQKNLTVENINTKHNYIEFSIKKFNIKIIRQLISKINSKFNDCVINFNYYIDNNKYNCTIYVK